MPPALPDLADIRAAVAGRERWAIDTLSGWVRHPSTLGNELAAQEYLAGVLEALGLAVRFEPVDPDRLARLPGWSPVDWSYTGRPNVVGCHDPPDPKGRSLILNGHVDVVSPEPTALWSSPPFEPVVGGPDRGQRWLSGRGAGDMKGGTTSYLWALGALEDLGLTLASPLTVESPIEEECTGNGTLALCANGYHADGCLIAEPFGETLLVRQLGVLWFQVRVLGWTTHVLGAGRGVNAIEKSWILITALRELEEELNRPERLERGYEHAVHPLNLNVGTIRGGDWASTVPGECVTRFRMGLMPGHRCRELMTTIEQRVAQAAQSDPWLAEFPPRVEYVGFQAEGCTFDTDSALAQALTRAHQRWRSTAPDPLSATCTTDVRFFNLYYGVPATCYGPEAENIHGADERVSIDSMRRVAEVVTGLLIDWCGVRRHS